MLSCILVPRARRFFWSRGPLQINPSVSRDENGFLVIQVLFVLIVTSGESTQLQAKQPGYPLQPVTELEILPFNLRILAMIGEINFDLLPSNAPLSVDPRQVFHFVQLKNNSHKPQMWCGLVSRFFFNTDG